MPDTITAAIIVIGNEILSGRTKDRNIAYLANALTEIGVRLMEARIVSDKQSEIVAAVNSLRHRYDYVFTTGGIGPTHDDITADSVAAAFGVGIGHHDEVYKTLKTYFEARGMEANEARMRMARIPDGASLINNDVSLAPGFQIDNVFVLAGVPRIAKSMFERARTRLRRGAMLHSRGICSHVGEGTVAAALSDIQDKYPEVEIGSYPWSRDGRYGTSLVARAADAELLECVAHELYAMVEELGGEPEWEDDTQ